MAAPYTTAKSGQPYRNNSGVILRVASGANAPVAPLSELTNTSVVKQYGWNPNIPTGAESSGNLGLQKVFSSRPITWSPYVVANNYLALGLPHTIAGTASSILQSASPDRGQPHAVNRFYAYQRLNITSWNAVTGAATKGANNGVTVLASGLNGQTGVKADQGPYVNDAIPGEFTVITGSVNPTQLDYAARTNP